MATTPLTALHAAALDTETTGLDPRRDRIVQLAAIRLHGTAVDRADAYASLVAPGIAVPPASTAIHGISEADLAAAPPFADLAADFAAWLGDAVLVGHSIGFDLAVLAAEHARAGLPWRPPPALDTRWLARLADPRLPFEDLDRLCAALGIAIAGRHTAPGDALAAAELFAALVPRLRAAGIRTLAEAQAASRALAARQPGAAEPAPPAPPPALDRIDSFPYRHRVAEVMANPPHIVAADLPLAGLIRGFAERAVSSAFLRTESGWGIATERDVLRALDRHGAAALAMPAAAIASVPLQTVPADAFVHRAIGRLSRLGLRHLGVTGADGALVGALTPRNLLRQRGSAAILLGDAIESGRSTAELGRAWAQLPAMARLLLAEAVPALQIAAVISAEICALTARAAALAEAAMLADGQGSPPAPYCVLVLGSAGRGESLLAADQDNALVHAGSEADDPWFAGLARRFCALLDEVGLPFCPGGVMAREPSWRHSESGWRDTVAAWLRRHRPDDLLHIDIFFDAVPVHGDAALGAALLAEARAMARAAPGFLKLLALQSATWRAPLGLFGGLSRDVAGRTDLKLGGLLPLVAGARILALRDGSAARATVDRLAASRSADAPALAAAHATLLGAVLAQQLEDSAAGVPPSPRVAVPRTARPAVVAALRQVAVMADLVAEGRK